MNTSVWNKIAHVKFRLSNVNLWTTFCLTCKPEQVCRAGTVRVPWKQIVQDIPIFLISLFTLYLIISQDTQTSTILQFSCGCRLGSRRLVPDKRKRLVVLNRCLDTFILHLESANNEYTEDLLHIALFGEIVKTKCIRGSRLHSDELQQYYTKCNYNSIHSKKSGEQTNVLLSMFIHRMTEIGSNGRIWDQSDYSVTLSCTIFNLNLQMATSILRMHNISLEI